MLTLQQFQILNACANDFELFYQPFAEVNYGGQLFPRSAGSGYARYVEDQNRPIRYSGKEVSSDLVELIRRGFLGCWRVPEDDDEERITLTNPGEIEFLPYWDFNCLTWDDHLERYGYGPHEFKTTAAGIEEINRAEYNAYVRELGWD